MITAKQIRVAPITAQAARAVIKRVHYSGSVVNNSQLHLGVYTPDGALHGAMQFGPPMDRSKLQGLVRETGWNDFLELNRMAFDQHLPRNSESRALGVALRMLRKQAPHVQWVISFADATQCGDGTIYRAAGFLLTGIRENRTLIELPDGRRVADVTYRKGKHALAKNGNAGTRVLFEAGAKRLPGFQLRYVFFLDPTARERLTVPVLAFSQIAEMGAGMYLGKSRGGKGSPGGTTTGEGGSIPTPPLQPEEA